MSMSEETAMDLIRALNNHTQGMAQLTQTLNALTIYDHRQEGAVHVLERIARSFASSAEQMKEASHRLARANNRY